MKAKISDPILARILNSGALSKTDRKTTYNTVDTTAAIVVKSAAMKEMIPTITAIAFEDFFVHPIASVMIEKQVPTK